jgi:hypothetical protein
LRDERFKRIVNEILTEVVKSKNDRKDILKLVKEFREKEDIDEFLGFIGSEVKIFNKKFFDEFVFDFLDIKSWNDFEKEAKSKKESIEIHNNSKRKNIHSDESSIIFRKKGKRAEIYYKEFPEIDDDKIVAVENYESFLSLDFSLFDRNYFVLLGGFASKMIQKFLKDKDVLFFVDFDFYGIEIFNKTKCRKKELFLPENLEELIKNYGSSELYKKQRFKKEYIKNDNKNTNYLCKLINKYSKCLEQEVLNVD